MVDNIQIDIPEQFYHGEMRCGYYVSPQIKELWAIELDLLKKFDEVCKRHNIHYYACGGTLLGAVRHSGLIPWDDDIDVMMFREDYDKLCEISSEFSYPYFFQTEYNDPGSLRGHAQLRNSMTTGIIAYEEQGCFSFNQGIFIDVFPIDNFPDNAYKRKIQQKRICLLKKLTLMWRDIPVHINDVNSQARKYVRKLLSPIIKTINKDNKASSFFYKRYEKEIKRYNSDHTNSVYIGVVSSNSLRFCWDRSLFSGEGCDMQFEMLSIPVPTGWKKMLDISYGDWEKPVIGTSNHGTLIFDVRHSYIDFYRKRGLQQ